MISKGYSNDKLKPLVSICTTAYNHEKYIKDALESFLMQRTTFEFEILINDDSSTDSTATIIREYEKKYPHLIKPTYQKENQYSKKVAPMTQLVIPRAKGKYIALSEGDDYWTDPYKLQKQVDFLEANPDYGMVHSDGDFYFTESGKLEKNYIKNRLHCPNNIENTFEAILRSEYPILTCSVMFRDADLKKVSFADQPKFKTGDTQLWLELSRIGKFYFFEESMVTRNILTESVAHSKNNTKLLEFKKSGYDLCKYFSEKYPTSETTKTVMHEKFNRVILYYAFRSNNKSEAITAWQMLKKYASANVLTQDRLYYWGARNRLINYFLKGFLFIIKSIRNLF